MQLTDGDRIRGLLATYCRLIDAGDFAGVGALMAHAVLKTDDGTPGTQHVVANAIFDEADVDGSVTVASTYLVFQAIPEVPLQPILTGTYVDRFEPVQLEGGQDGWRFAERRFGIGRSGVVEHHLSITL